MLDDWIGGRLVSLRDGFAKCGLGCGFLDDLCDVFLRGLADHVVLGGSDEIEELLQLPVCGHEAGGLNGGDCGHPVIRGAGVIEQGSDDGRIFAPTQDLAEKDDPDIGDDLLGGGELGDAGVDIRSVGCLCKEQGFVNHLSVGVLGNGGGVPEQDLELALVYGNLGGGFLGGNPNHLVVFLRLGIFLALLKDEKSEADHDDSEHDGDGHQDRRGESLFLCGILVSKGAFCDLRRCRGCGTRCEGHG